MLGESSGFGVWGVGGGGVGGRWIGLVGGGGGGGRFDRTTEHNCVL